MKFKKENFENKIVCGDSSTIIRKIPDESVDLVITSPPYFGCREYGDDFEGLGREADPRNYVKNVVDIIHRLMPVLKKSGSLYLNVGDVYFGTKGFSRNTGKWSRKTDSQYKSHKIVVQDKAYLQHKQRLMLPERIAIALQDKGWVLRNNIIWEKPNPLPCHAKDRRLPVYENIFHFVKNKKYYYDLEKAKELNHYRDIVKCTIEPYKGHMATFPERLVAPLIEITCPKDGVVLDPFLGGGTIAKVATDLGRKYIGIELCYQYCLYTKKRVEESGGMFASDRTVEIEIRKPAPKAFTCSICQEEKKTNFKPYWGGFLKTKHLDEKRYQKEYVCRSCRLSA